MRTNLSAFVVYARRGACANASAKHRDVFGHVPWLGMYFGKIPAATGNLVVLLNACAERTAARLKRWSEKKDLFHYLVRLTSSFDLSTRQHVSVRLA